jgi:hypothetical protein
MNPGGPGMIKVLPIVDASVLPAGRLKPGMLIMDRLNDPPCRRLWPKTTNRSGLVLKGIPMFLHQGNGDSSSGPGRNHPGGHW